MASGRMLEPGEVKGESKGDKDMEPSAQSHRASPTPCRGTRLLEGWDVGAGWPWRKVVDSSHTLL